MEHRWHKVWPVWVPKTLDITKPTSEYFRDWAYLTPDRVALSFYGQDIRYAELNRLIDKTAWALVGLGVKPGDRVAIHMENCPQFVIAYFAIQRAGAVVVAINPMFKGAELEFELNDAGIETLIGAAGIGRAAARAFAQEGAAVSIADVDEAGGLETVRIISESGGHAFFMKIDVSQADQVAAFVAATMRRFGGLNCAFNNAGIEGGAFLTAQYPEQEWDKVISVNQKGVMLCMKYEIEQMVRNSGGAIVNTSSGAGIRGLAYQSAYSTSKHAIIGLTRTAAVEYAKKGIRINAICPGFIDTGLTLSVLAKKPHLADKYKKLIPMGRFGKEEEVAEAAVWLLSDASSFITGQALVMDGGASA